MAAKSRKSRVPSTVKRARAKGTADQMAHESKEKRERAAKKKRLADQNKPKARKSKASATTDRSLRDQYGSRMGSRSNKKR